MIREQIRYDNRLFNEDSYVLKFETKNQIKSFK